MLGILLIAVALAMDCFTVSIVCGLLLGKWETRPVLTTALLFGFFQALMPLIGWFLTSRFSTYIEAYDHWIAFGILLFLGGKMILDGLHGKKDEEPLKGGALFIQGIATSIDALSVGFTIAEYSLPFALIESLIIGAVTFGICLAGVGWAERSAPGWPEKHPSWAESS